VPTSLRASGSEGTPGASGSGSFQTSSQFLLDPALAILSPAGAPLDVIPGPTLAPRGTNLPPT
jgi:hypothetical protein